MRVRARWSTTSSCWRRSRTCGRRRASARSEEHTSELQLRLQLVCRLLLEKKNFDAHMLVCLDRLPRQTRLPRLVGGNAVPLHVLIRAHISPCRPHTPVFLSTRGSFFTRWL